MSELTQYIQCDIELNVSGPSQKTVASWRAAALRRIADQLEKDDFKMVTMMLKTIQGDLSVQYILTSQKDIMLTRISPR